MPFVNIHLWRDVHHARRIDDLLGASGKTAILYEAAPGFGHWCTLFRTDRGICFADPYGEMVDDQLLRLDPAERVAMNETQPLLYKLMDASPYYWVEYDETPHQIRREGVNTCGRHACLRLHLHELPPDEYSLAAFAPFSQNTPDDVVCWWTDPLLN